MTPSIGGALPKSTSASTPIFHFGGNQSEKPSQSSSSAASFTFEGQIAQAMSQFTIGHNNNSNQNKSLRLVGILSDEPNRVTDGPGKSRISTTSKSFAFSSIPLPTAPSPSSSEVKDPLLEDAHELLSPKDQFRSPLLNNPRNLSPVKQFKCFIRNSERQISRTIPVGGVWNASGGQRAAGERSKQILDLPDSTRLEEMKYEILQRGEILDAIFSQCEKADLKSCALLSKDLFGTVSKHLYHKLDGSTYIALTLAATPNTGRYIQLVRVITSIPLYQLDVIAPHANPQIIWHQETHDRSDLAASLVFKKGGNVGRLITTMWCGEDRKRSLGSSGTSSFVPTATTPRKQRLAFLQDLLKRTAKYRMDGLHLCIEDSEANFENMADLICTKAVHGGKQRKGQVCDINVRDATAYREEFWLSGEHSSKLKHLRSFANFGSDLDENRLFEMIRHMEKLETLIFTLSPYALPSKLRQTLSPVGNTLRFLAVNTRTACEGEKILHLVLDGYLPQLHTLHVTTTFCQLLKTKRINQSQVLPEEPQVCIGGGTARHRLMHLHIYTDETDIIVPRQDAASWLGENVPYATQIMIVPATKEKTKRRLLRAWCDAITVLARTGTCRKHTAEAGWKMAGNDFAASLPGTVADSDRAGLGPALPPTPSDGLAGTVHPSASE